MNRNLGKFQALQQLHRLGRAFQDSIDAMAAPDLEQQVFS
jgi:hypothetical protein